MKTVLDFAAAYIAAGLKCHPVCSPAHANRKKAGKSPKLFDWPRKFLSFEEFKIQYADGDNLGVVTGKASGIVCVDIDPKNGGNKWYDENSDRLGHCLYETTGSGGVHLYYKYPVDVQYVGSRLGFSPGVDILADGGKQVVTAPSIHTSGVEYLIKYGLTLLDLEAEADFVPEWLLKELSKRPPEMPIKGSIRPVALELSEADVQAARVAIARMQPAIAGQSGDNTTFVAAAVAKDYGLSEEMAFQALRDCYNQRCVPPWDLKELRKKVRNAYGYGQRQLGIATPQGQFVEEEEPAPPVLKGSEGPPEERVSGAYKTKGPVMDSALSFIQRNNGHLKFAQDQAYQYFPEIGCWKMITVIDFRCLVWKDIETTAPKVHKRISMGRFYQICDTVRQVLQAEGFQPLADTWLNGIPGDFIALKNGILDIKAKKLLPHSSQWFSYTVLPFEYNPEAEACEFKNFLRSVWDEDHRTYDAWLLWMGYLLISDNRQQKFAVLIGESRAGKGTLTRVVESLIGDQNKVACSLDALGGDFGMAPLVGKRLGVFSDAYRIGGALGEVSTGRLVSIIGNDPQQVNRKGQTALDVLLGIKIMMVCNEIPSFGNAKDQMTNRMIVFPFQKTFAGEEDLELGDKLKKELPGIFNLALDGAQALLSGRRLEQPPSGVDTLLEIQESLNTALAFKSEMLIEILDPEKAKSEFLETQLIYDLYKKWCNDSGHKGIFSRRRFVQAILRSAKAVKGSRKWIGDLKVRIIYGLRIKDGAYVNDFQAVGPLDRGPLPF